MTSEAAASAHPAPGYAFVVGTGRCGSSLVHEILARHPGVGFISNVDDRLGTAVPARLNGVVYRSLPPGTTTKGRVRFAPSEGYRSLDREVSPLLSTPFRDLVAADATPWIAERFRRFFDRRAGTGETLLLHKFTGWPRSGFVQAVLPGARFVHVVRDGRAVAGSWLQMPWWRGNRGPSGWHFGPLPPQYQEEWQASGHSFVLLAGLAWKLLMDAHEAARNQAEPGTWIDIRYEDLLADPVATTAKILTFVGLEPAREFDAALSRYRLDSSRADAYRRDLGPSGLEVLDASLAAHLGRYGYA